MSTKARQTEDPHRKAFQLAALLVSRGANGNDGITGDDVEMAKKVLSLAPPQSRGGFMSGAGKRLGSGAQPDWSAVKVEMKLMMPDDPLPQIPSPVKSIRTPKTKGVERNSIPEQTAELSIVHEQDTESPITHTHPTSNPNTPPFHTEVDISYDSPAGPQVIHSTYPHPSVDTYPAQPYVEDDVDEAAGELMSEGEGFTAPQETLGMELARAKWKELSKANQAIDYHRPSTIPQDPGSSYGLVSEGLAKGETRTLRMADLGVDGRNPDASNLKTTMTHDLNSGKTGDHPEEGEFKGGKTKYKRDAALIIMMAQKEHSLSALLKEHDLSSAAAVLTLSSHPEKERNIRMATEMLISPRPGDPIYTQESFLRFLSSFRAQAWATYTGLGKLPTVDVVDTPLNDKWSYQQDLKQLTDKLHSGFRTSEKQWEEVLVQTEQIIHRQQRETGKVREVIRQNHKTTEEHQHNLMKFLTQTADVINDTHARVKVLHGNNLMTGTESKATDSTTNDKPPVKSCDNHLSRNSSLPTGLESKISPSASLPPNFNANPMIYPVQSSGQDPDCNYGNLRGGAIDSYRPPRREYVDAQANYHRGSYDRRDRHPQQTFFLPPHRPHPEPFNRSAQTDYINNSGRPGQQPPTGAPEAMDPPTLPSSRDMDPPQQPTVKTALGADRPSRDGSHRNSSQPQRRSRRRSEVRTRRPSRRDSPDHSSSSSSSSSSSDDNDHPRHRASRRRTFSPGTDDDDGSSDSRNHRSNTRHRRKHKHYKIRKLTPEQIGIYEPAKTPANAFVRRVDQMVEWYGKTRVLEVLPLCLKGSASSWLAGLPRSTQRKMFRSVRVFCKELLRRFTQDEFELEEKANKLKFYFEGPNAMEIRTYVSDKAGLLADAGITKEDDVVKRLWRGLDDELKPFVPIESRGNRLKQFERELYRAEPAARRYHMVTKAPAIKKWQKDDKDPKDGKWSKETNDKLKKVERVEEVKVVERSEKKEIRKPPRPCRWCNGDHWDDKCPKKRGTATSQFKIAVAKDEWDSEDECVYQHLQFENGYKESMEEALKEDKESGNESPDL